MEQTTVAVLGSNGFGGASYVKYALAAGYRVIGISRSPEPVVAYLPYRWEEHESFRFYQIDINRDHVALKLLLEQEQPQYIVNFASQSMVAQSWDHPADWMQTNVVAQTRLMEMLQSADWLKHYLHFSTPEVYGSTEGWVKEHSNYDPSTPYALSRAAGDQIVELWHRTYGVPMSITRAANIYGEGQQVYRIITRTILCCLTGDKLQLHGGGVSERAFIHMEDVSSALHLILEQKASGETYHISTNESISIRALVELICNKMNCSFDDVVNVSEERLGKDMQYFLSSDYICSSLNWKPTVSLQQGLDRSIEWVNTYREELLALPQAYQHKP